MLLLQISWWLKHALLCFPPYWAFIAFLIHVTHDPHMRSPTGQSRRSPIVLAAWSSTSNMSERGLSSFLLKNCSLSSKRKRERQTDRASIQERKEKFTYWRTMGKYLNLKGVHKCQEMRQSSLRCIRCQVFTSRFIVFDAFKRVYSIIVEFRFQLK